MIGSMRWNNNKGYGFDETPAMTYSGDYFQKYQEMDATNMGEALTDARVKLVSSFYCGKSIIDIGIGGGKFCKQMPCFGYDVSIEANKWLVENGIYRDPYKSGADALTFWDSLEHIPDPAAIVKMASQWVFVSMPIYSGIDDCMKSKHYKPGEHLHYWTDDGLRLWFAEQGFALAGENDAETKAGREGIKSYAFFRKLQIEG